MGVVDCKNRAPSSRPYLTAAYRASSRVLLRCELASVPTTATLCLWPARHRPHVESAHCRAVGSPRMCGWSVSSMVRAGMWRARHLPMNHWTAALSRWGLIAPMPSLRRCILGSSIETRSAHFA